MIEYIKGILVKKVINKIIIEVNGIGYSVNVSNFVINSLPEQNKEIKLYISETNSMYSGTNSWYGFLSEDEKELFETIKTVNKIGAKGSLDILSRIGNKSVDFKICIINGDIQKLHDIFGFTNQKAEKLVLGLKNKIDTISIDINSDYSSGTINFINSYENDAIEALKILGYNAAASKKVVSQILKDTDNSNLSLEDIIRFALKKL